LAPQFRCIQSSTLDFDANVGLLIGANVCLLSLKPIQKVQVAFRRDRQRKPKQLVYRKHDGEELSQAKRERLTIKPIAC
jgi:hypothetical protein